MAVARLGTPEITEPSEELRLMLVTLLTSLVQLCRSKMAPYLGDMVAILQRTIIDPYPEVKKVSTPPAQIEWQEQLQQRNVATFLKFVV